ncbi:CD177 antigen-like isoform X1 [Apodemus sylvaticus]|uniref:CD177 antigen-like isoform X1 n=1 Tax=Apodemus sylvaticus TaxID=10129 RepID=UPI00224269DA|nr:CD177 antigen-like isoform X1 [Apodemus sylvaticus]
MDRQMHAECLCWALLSRVLLQLCREVGRRGQQSPGSQVWCEGQSVEGTQQGRRDAERGEKSLILASKGSSHPGSNNSLDVQVFSAGPGIVAASYAHFCVTDLCNNANSSSVLLDSLSLPDSELGTTQCPVCLHFRGSCAQHTAFVVCPKGTHCYLSDMTVEGGGVNAAFSLDGCLSDFATNVLKGQTSIGIFSAMEASDSHSSVSSSRVLVPSPLLAWMFGLSPLLSPLFAEICPLS